MSRLQHSNNSPIAKSKPGRHRPPLGLRYAADLRSLALLAALGTCLFLLWTGWLRSGWIFALSLPLAFSACSVAHNHIHLPMFRSRKANSAFSCLLGFFCGQPPCGIIDAHNVRHHGKLGTEADFVRPSVARFRWNWINVATFPLAATVAMYRSKAREPATARRPSRQRLAERTLFHGGVTALLLADASATLLYLAVPWLFGQFCIVGINLVQHQGCDPDSHWDHSRNITGAATNWLTLNGGFHTAHHRHPALHWSLLPDFHRRVVVPRTAPELQFRSLASAVFARMCAPVPDRPPAKAQPQNGT
ncbi:fatty acid desaturase [soil metagenome]